MKQKTISGHYGAVYSLSHNNRKFIPKNVDINRIPWNYDCVAAGQEAYLDINNPRHISEFWDRYRELNALYWSDKAIADTLAYEKYQEHLEYMRRLSRSIYPIPHNAMEALITLLLLPLLIPCGIYLSKRQKEIKEEWEEYKQEQWIRDLAYKATRISLRQALYEHDCKSGTRYLNSLDYVVKEMGEQAGNYVPQVGRVIAVTQTPLQYATLEDPNWQPPFANGLIVLNLTMHADEATPGVHLTCIPYSRSCKRGPKVQAALGRAMAGMGYPSTWKDVLDENGACIPKRDRNGNIIYNKDGSVRYQQEPDKQGIIDWIEEQKKWLQKEMMRRYGWDREYKGAHPRGNLTTPDYQVARSKERLEALQQDFEKTFHDYKQQVIRETNKLADAVDSMLEQTSELDMIIRYLQDCNEEDYQAVLTKASDYYVQLAMEKERKMLNNLISGAENRAIRAENK